MKKANQDLQSQNIYIDQQHSIETNRNIRIDDSPQMFKHKKSKTQAFQQFQVSNLSSILEGSPTQNTNNLSPLREQTSQSKLSDFNQSKLQSNSGQQSRLQLKQNTMQIMQLQQTLLESQGSEIDQEIQRENSLKNEELLQQIEKQNRLQQLSHEKSRIADTVNQELYKKELNTGAHNYVLQRIQNFVEGEGTKNIQLRNQQRVSQMEQQTNKEIYSKKFSMKIEDQDEEELIKAMKKLMPKTVQNKDKNNLLDRKVFDFNKYSVVSPFVSNNNQTQSMMINQLSQGGPFSPTNQSQLNQQQISSQIGMRQKKLGIKLQPIKSAYLSSISSPKNSISPLNQQQTHSWVNNNQFLQQKAQLLPHNNLNDIKSQEDQDMMSNNRTKHNNFERDNKLIMRQIDSTKDLLFLEMIKYQRQTNQFKKSLDEGLQEEWLKMANDIQNQVEKKAQNAFQGLDEEQKWKYFSLLMDGSRPRNGNSKEGQEYTNTNNDIGTGDSGNVMVSGMIKQQSRTRQKGVKTNNRQGQGKSKDVLDYEQELFDDDILQQIDSL
eukprot:403335941